MDGFHLFQDKIKGEKKIKGELHSEPLFFFTETGSNQVNDFDVLANCYTFEYDASDKLLVPETDFDDFYSFYEEPLINFKLDFTDPHQKPQLCLEDHRDALYNYNNTLPEQGKRSIMMFYD